MLRYRRASTKGVFHGRKRLPLRWRRLRCGAAARAFVIKKSSLLPHPRSALEAIGVFTFRYRMASRILYYAKALTASESKCAAAVPERGRGLQGRHKHSPTVPFCLTDFSDQSQQVRNPGLDEEQTPA